MNKHIYFLLILLNKNYNKHFLKRYVKLASFYKQRNFKKAKGLHHHHIIPDSFDGAKSNENMVYITPREHFILHWMLYKAFPKSSMVTAFKSMCSGWGHMDFRISSRVYENVMLEFGKRQSEYSNKKVKEGTHHFSGETLNKKRVKEGTHHFLDKEKARDRVNKRIEEGTHPWLDKEMQSQRAKKRVADGTHNLLGGKLVVIIVDKGLQKELIHFLVVKYKENQQRKELQREHTIF